MSYIQGIWGTVHSVFISYRYLKSMREEKKRKCFCLNNCFAFLYWKSQHSPSLTFSCIQQSFFMQIFRSILVSCTWSWLTGTSRPKCNSLIILFDTSTTVWYLKELQRQNQCVRLWHLQAPRVTATGQIHSIQNIQYISSFPQALYTSALYLVADFIPLSMQQLDSLLQDGQILSADVAGQGLSQHSQMGQIPGPAIKCILQVLKQKQCC